MNYLEAILVSAGFWAVILGFLYRNGGIDISRVNGIIKNQVDRTFESPMPTIQVFETIRSVLLKVYSKNEGISLSRCLLLSFVISIIATSYTYVTYNGNYSFYNQRLVEIETGLLNGEYDDLRRLVGSKEYIEAFKRASRAITRYENHSDEYVKIRRLEESYNYSLINEILKDENFTGVMSALTFRDSNGVITAGRHWFISLILATILCALIDYLCVNKLVNSKGSGGRLRSVVFALFLYILSIDIYMSIFFSGYSVIGNMSKYIPTFMGLLLAAMLLKFGLSEFSNNKRKINVRKISLASICFNVYVFLLGAILVWINLSDISGIFRSIESSLNFYRISGVLNYYTLPQIMSASVLSPIIIAIVVSLVIFLCRILGWITGKYFVFTVDGARLLGATYLGALITFVTVSIALIFSLREGVGQIIYWLELIWL